VVYISIYFLVTRFLLKKQYVFFILAIIILLAANLCSNYFIANRTSILFNTSKNGESLFLDIWRRGFIKGFQNSVALVSIAVGIKLAKYWYVKQQDNSRLTALKIYNEKRVLKANIHPDFLLYSLDNLRRRIAVSYRDSAEMILNLSEVFSYILYDCSEELLSLREEIAAVENLIIVERIIHKNHVVIDFTTNITGENKLVPPLLIFSFVQKIFAEGEPKNKKLNNISVHIYTLYDELCVTCKLNYFNIIRSDFIPLEKLNENEKKLYALFNRFDIIRNVHENNYVINLATTLYEPEKIKA